MRFSPFSSAFAQKARKAPRLSGGSEPSSCLCPAQVKKRAAARQINVTENPLIFELSGVIFSVYCAKKHFFSHYCIYLWL
jgi:hypothetical protein